MTDDGDDHEDTAEDTAEVANTVEAVKPQDDSTYELTLSTPTELKLLEFLQQQNDTIHDLEQQLLLEQSKHMITFQNLKDNESLLMHYTGLPCKVIFLSLLTFASNFHISTSSWTVSSISVEDQLLITLMKLRHNFTHIWPTCMLSVSHVLLTSYLNGLMYCISCCLLV